jgi:hypothetical protein
MWCKPVKGNATVQGKTEGVEVPGAGEEARVACPWGRRGENRAPHIYDKVLPPEHTDLTIMPRSMLCYRPGPRLILARPGGLCLIFEMVIYSLSWQVAVTGRTEFL